MLAGAAARAGAVERQPWPVIDLSAADGSTVATSRLVQSGRWVVLYVSAGCVPCESALAAADGLDDASAATRVIVIVTGDVAILTATAARYEKLAAAIWLADPAHALAERVRTSTVPQIIGVRDGTIEWSLGGVLTDTAAVRSVLLHWLMR